MDIPYQEINSKTIDRWVEEGWEWGKPVSHEEYEKAKAGTWDVKLTPVKFVPHSWLGELKGKRVLGLASGGGQQMPIFAALGAQCTVLDYSQRQLDSEKLVAEREGYDITIVRADMTKRLPFDENSFDLIFHPVSNCYVYAVLPIWRECARVLKPGGRLLAGLDNGLNFAFDEDETRIINTLPFNPLEDEEQMRQLEKDKSGVQFPTPRTSSSRASSRRDCSCWTSTRTPTATAICTRTTSPPTGRRLQERHKAAPHNCVGALRRSFSANFAVGSV